MHETITNLPFAAFGHINIPGSNTPAAESNLQTCWKFPR